MEHGYLDHGATICEHQVHVPMMIRFPGGKGAKTVSEPVRGIDAIPTVMDALGVAAPPDIDGRSLLPMLRGEKEELPIFTESDYRLFVHLRGMKKGGKKFILDLGDNEKSLYDLGGDPQETKNIAEAEGVTTYEMEQSVRAWMGSMKSDPNSFLNKQEEHIKIF
jgi:arylsulfatase A-like enzyme